MPYVLQIDRHAQTVIAKAEQDLCTQTRLDLITEISNHLRINQLSRALLHMSQNLITESEPLSSAFELVNHMRNMGIPPGTRMAFVQKKRSDHHEYFETVAQFDGWNLRHFNNEEHAMEWLKSSV